jgi:hypothetical protein
MEDSSREYMETWFAWGETPEGLEEAREYLYRTSPSRLSPSGLMCTLQAARDALRARDAEIATLRAQLNDAQQGELFVAEVIQWRLTKDELPDADIAVLVSVEGEADAHEGYYGGSDDGWLWANAGSITGNVYAWAPMPDVSGGAS